MDRVTTVNRVPLHTEGCINRRIARETDCRVQYFRAHPEEIP